MNLYIDQNYHWSDWLMPSKDNEEIEQFHEEVRNWCEVAGKFGCQHQVHYTEHGAEITVYQQKCTLDEVDMNTLFDGFLANMFEIGIKYSPIGGKGCDFAIRITDFIKRI